MKPLCIGTILFATVGLWLLSGKFALAQVTPCTDPAGPCSWIEVFDVDPFTNPDSPSDHWQPRGNNGLPDYSGGMALFDGAPAWTLIDTRDPYFEGETQITIVMDANPGTAGDRGAGW